MDKFLIAPYDSSSGLHTDVKPFEIPDNAFAELNNLYIFRGRVKKRFGERFLGEDPLLSRLRIQIATTNGSGDTPAGTFVPLIAGVPAVTPAIGQMFSIGTQVFTVTALGAPANLLISGTATNATFNTTSGALIIAGADATTPVYYYPNLPVMGLLTMQQGTINNEMTIAFDTRFAYQYINGWTRLAAETDANASVWTSDNTHFFWGTTWLNNDGFTKVFFVTNYNENEANFMRYLLAGSWHNFVPQITSVGTVNYLYSARMLIVFKNRLIALNTWEGSGIPGDHYPNRCRYSQEGSPLEAQAWYQDVAGRGNAIDAATAEAIISAAFVRDRLIVYFEESTWELVYTGNQAYPFSWLKLNNELGAESTFSVVPFDKVALGVGNVGIISCNGVEVNRIDNSIPNEIFNIRNQDGIDRVYGVRDYRNEMVYWTMGDQYTTALRPFPNRLLVYNYRNNTWSFYDDSITCFGYYYSASGITWDSTEVTWDDDVTWSDGSLQTGYRNVLAGNQQGYTFICDQGVTINAGALSITNLTVVGNNFTVTAINHTLSEGSYIYLDGIIDSTGNFASLNGTIQRVLTPLTADTFTFNYTGAITFAGTYAGGGQITRVSNLQLKTKAFNLYSKQDRNSYIQKVNFFVDKTAHGQMRVQFIPSTSEDIVPTVPLLGTSTLDTYAYNAANNPGAPYNYETNATQVWHPVYFNAEGSTIQFKMYLDDDLMRTVNIMRSDFEMHAMCIYAQPTSRQQ